MFRNFLPFLFLDRALLRHPEQKTFRSKAHQSQPFRKSFHDNLMQLKSPQAPFNVDSGPKTSLLETSTRMTNELKLWLTQIVQKGYKNTVFQQKCTQKCAGSYQHRIQPPPHPHRVCPFGVFLVQTWYTSQSSIEAMLHLCPVAEQSALTDPFRVTEHGSRRNTEQLTCRPCGTRGVSDAQSFPVNYVTQEGIFGWYSAR